MIIQDILPSLIFYFLFFLINSFFLPISSNIFKNFTDKGYVFSRILGIAVVSYLIFILGIFKIAPFTIVTIWTIIALIIIFNLILIFKKKFSISKTDLPIFVFEEVIFLAAFVFMAYVRAHQPNINGLEKFMDFGFVNSILRADYFPPKDMWFTPYSINYYYFGHLITAVITKLSGITSAVTYNLMLAALFAMTFTGSFSIVFNLISFIFKKNKLIKIKALTGGLLAAFLVSLSGNMQTIYSVFSPMNNDKPIPFWELTFSPSSFPNSYWYPNATRFIHNTIHEFPGYSWVVSDLHGHVLDIPFVLLAIALLLSVFFLFKEEKLFRIHFSLFILLAFMLAIMYMTNAWDTGVYLLLTGVVILFLEFLRIRNDKTLNTSNNPILQILTVNIRKRIKKLLLKNWIIDLLIGLIFYLGVIGIFFYIFTFPFNRFFYPFVSGVGVLCAPQFLIDMQKLGPFIFEENHCQTSPLWQLGILYGFFYFFVFSFIAFILKMKKIAMSDIFVLILITVSSILILIPEFIYVKDIYPDHYRANTMFKLTYQAFIMLSLSSAFIIFRISSSIKTKNIPLSFVWLLTSGLLLFFALTYPFLAINSYYEELKNYKGLNGINYLKEQYSSDFEAIVWLNENVKGQPVILEAQGDSYTDFARVSANTGLPTVLGWTVHEWLWRGTYDIPAPRIEEIKTLYESENEFKTNNLIEKYKIKLVFIGDFEREKYNVNEERFKKKGEVIFRSGNTYIYKVN